MDRKPVSEKDIPPENNVIIEQFIGRIVIDILRSQGKIVKKKYPTPAQIEPLMRKIVTRRYYNVLKTAVCFCKRMEADGFKAYSHQEKDLIFVVVLDFMELD